jgi:hypothetical protein
VGYRHASKTYRLVFEGDLAGLEVICRAGTVQQFVAISQLESNDATASLRNMNNFNKLCSAFAVSLSSWNLEDERTGLPVPGTLEGLFSQDVGLVLSIMEAWMSAVVSTVTPEIQQVDVPDDIPMEALG